MVYHQHPVFVHLGPCVRDAVQTVSFGVEFSAYCIRRDDDISFLTAFKDEAQSSRMIAMSVGDEDIVNAAEVYAQLSGIADEHVTGPRVEEDVVPLRLQQDGQSMLSFK